MSGHTSQVGQRADKLVASDDPHERYTADGRPVLSKTERGQVVEKTVNRYTLSCGDCGLPATYNEKNEPECPKCGLLCSTKDERETPPIVRDAKAAGRLD
jgi:hypothetical protein